MKKRNFNLFGTAALAVVLTLSSSAYAQLTWDTTPGTVGAGNGTIETGSGTWDTTNGNWTTDGGANNIAWINGSAALLGDAGASYTVDIADGGVTVDDLTLAPGTGKVSFRSVTDNLGTIAIGASGATWDTGGRELELVNDQANDTPLIILGGATLAIIGGGEFDTGEKPNGADWTVPLATLDIQSATLVRGNTASVGQFATVKMADGSTFSAERNSDQTYSNDWELGASATDTTNFSRRWNARTPTYAGVVSGAGGMTIGTNGTGYSYFTGANTFTGKVVINGRMRVNNGALGAAPVSPVTDQITIDGGLLSAGGNTSIAANQGITVGAAGATLSSDATWFNIDSVVSGSLGGDVTITGPGRTEFQGNTNTYDGRTIVDAGELQINNDDNLGAVPGAPDADNIILKNGGQIYSIAVTYNPNRGVTLENGGGFVVTGGASTYGGTITGTGGFQLGRDDGNANFFIVTSDTSDYTGGTRIRKGHLQLGIDEAIPADTVVTIGGNGGSNSRFVLDGFTQTVGGLDIAGGNTRQVVNLQSTAAPNLSNTGTVIIDVADGEAFTFDAAFGVNTAEERGNFNVVKNGLGTQNLGTVSIGGTVTVNAGTLQIGNSAGGATTGAVTVNGGVLQITDDLTAASITTNLGGTLSIGNGGTAGSIVGDPALVIDGTLLFDRSDALTYPGDISGSGGIQVDGGGTITLTGTNSFTGAVEVIDGTLIAPTSTSLPDYSKISVAANELFLVTFDGAAWTSANIAALSSTANWLDPTAYLGLDISAGPISFGDAATGTHGLWIQGGNNVLTFGTAQTYTGPTRIFQGTIQLTANDQLPAGSPVTLGGLGNSILDLAGFNQTIGGLNNLSNNGRIVDNSSATASTFTINVPADTSYAYGSNINESGGGAINIVKNGDGAQIFDKTTVSSYTGSATVNGGILGFRYPVVIDPVTQAITVNSGAAFMVDAGGVDEWLMTDIDTLFDNATFAAGSGLAVRTNDDPFDYTSDIVGAIGLIKAGDNTLTLSGTNTYTGKTVVEGSYLVIDADADLGAAPGAPTTDHLTLDGGGLQATAALSIDANRGITLLDGGGLFANNLLEMTVAAPITGAGSLSLSGAGGAGAGFLELTGTNDYTGETVINQASLKVSSTANLPDASNLRINGVGILLLNGDLDGGNAADFTRSLGTGAGQVQFTNGGGFAASGADRSFDIGGAGADLTWGVDGFFPPTLPTAFTFFLSAPEATHTTTLANGIVLPEAVNYSFATINSSAELDGVISGDISGAGGLRVRFSGTLALEGDNTYGRPTIIEDDGTLLVNGDQSGATGNVTASADSTLGGSGTIGGAITIGDGGTLAPGASVGTLTAKSDVAFSNNSTFAVEIDSSGTPSADKLVVDTGAITIGTGVTLDATDLASTVLTPGVKLTIIDYTGSTGLTGTFAGLADGATITVGGNDFTIDYDDGGDFVTLTVTGASDAYLTWAASKGLTAPNAGKGDDKENDGIENQLEWVLGGNPLVSDTSILPTAVKSGTDLIFTFNRADDTIGNVDLFVQYGSDLVGWTDEAVPATTSGIFTITNTGATDSVVATIPDGGATELFVRLKTTTP